MFMVKSQENINAIFQKLIFQKLVSDGMVVWVVKMSGSCYNL